MPEEFVTLTEAARRVGLSEPAIRRRVRRGDLAAYPNPRDLRSRLIRADDLAAFFGLAADADGSERGGDMMGL